MTFLHMFQGEQTRDSDITAVLMVDTCVWVGTRDGHLYVYHVTHKRSRPSGQAVSVQRRCLAKCSTSTRSQVTDVPLDCKYKGVSPY